MKYIVDHDLHIHSNLSSCSNDPEQTNERILQYAKENGFNTVCLTNHFWDETVKGASEWYRSQNFAHLRRALPLPQSENIRFLFGCETDLDKHTVLGISKERIDEFDFVIIPTTHFHMEGFTLFEEDFESPKGRAYAWVKHLDAVLNMDLPFHKIGIAHLTGNIMCPKEWRAEMLSLIAENEMERLFAKAAKLGVGIELNSSCLNFSPDNTAVELRPYKTAKACGCKFYCGSDAHHPVSFENSKEILERIVDMLDLSEEDKFVI